MTIDEPLSQSTLVPEGSFQPDPIGEQEYESPLHDDGRDESSKAAESIQYDWRDSLAWNNQLIDINYVSMFRNNFDFPLDFPSMPQLRPPD